MSYTKHTWTDGELVTAAKMNNIENGIEEASSGGGSGGGVLVVTVGESNICDASYNDVISAVAAGKVVMLKTSAGGTGFPFGYKYLVSYMEHQGQYAVAFGEQYDVCSAQSATDALVVVE